MIIELITSLALATLVCAFLYVVTRYMTREKEYEKECGWKYDYDYDNEKSESEKEKRQKCQNWKENISVSRFMTLMIFGVVFLVGAGLVNAPIMKYAMLLAGVFLVVGESIARWDKFSDLYKISMYGIGIVVLSVYAYASFVLGSPTKALNFGEVTRLFTN